MTRFMIAICQILFKGEGKARWVGRDANIGTWKEGGKGPGVIPSLTAAEEKEGGGRGEESLAIFIFPNTKRRGERKKAQKTISDALLNRMIVISIPRKAKQKAFPFSRI